MRSKLNKDFYDELPAMVCEVLEDLISKYSRTKWFDKAWNEYRDHVLTSTMEEVKMPGYIFGAYISRKKK